MSQTTQQIAQGLFAYYAGNSADSLELSFQQSLSNRDKNILQCALRSIFASWFAESLVGLPWVDGALYTTITSELNYLVGDRRSPKIETSIAQAYGTWEQNAIRHPLVFARKTNVRTALQDPANRLVKEWANKIAESAFNNAHPILPLVGLSEEELIKAKFANDLLNLAHTVQQSIMLTISTNKELTLSKRSLLIVEAKVAIRNSWLARKLWPKGITYRSFSAAWKFLQTRSPTYTKKIVDLFDYAINSIEQNSYHQQSLEILPLRNKAGNGQALVYMDSIDVLSLVLSDLIDRLVKNKQGTEPLRAYWEQL